MTCIAADNFLKHEKKCLFLKTQNCNKQNVLLISKLGKCQRVYYISIFSIKTRIFCNYKSTMIFYFMTVSKTFLATPRKRFDFGTNSFGTRRTTKYFSKAFTHFQSRQLFLSFIFLTNLFVGNVV